MFLGITGAVTLALLSLVFFVPTDDGLVQIELADPTLSVKVDGNTFTVENLKSPLKFSTGDHKLIIEQDGQQISASDFTIIEGDTLRLRVAILAGDLILENNGKRTKLPMEIRPRALPKTVASVEGSGRTIPGRVPVGQNPTKTTPSTSPRVVQTVATDSVVVCDKLTSNAPPVGLHPDAAAFSSEITSQNGFQFSLPDWKAWSANDWQFDFRFSGDKGRGFYLIQPFRFGHLTLLLKRDNCGLYAFTEWAEKTPTPHPSVKLPGFDQVFPLKADQSYRISSRVDEVGSYLLSIDDTPVLQTLFPPIREYIVDGKAVAGLPKGPVRPLVFRSASRYSGDGLIMKWPLGSGGLVIDHADEGVNEATGIHVLLTEPTSPHPVAEKLQQGLVAWYPFDNVQGRTVVDASGNGHNATASGDLTPVPGMAGGAIEMQAETLIPIGEVAGFDWNEPFTLCAWIRPFSLSDARYIFRKRNDDPSKGYTLMLRRETLGFGAVNKGGTNMLGMYAVKGVIHLRHWSHVAVAYDGTGRKLSVAMYVDGRQVRYENTSGTLSASIKVTDPLRIGRDFVGQLDDLRIYDRMLSNEEVTFLAAPDRGP
jgi:hypothetical protein